MNPTPFIRTGLWLVLAAAAVPASALEFTLSEGVQGKFAGTLSIGSSYRTEEPSADNYGATAANRIGLPVGRLSGNADSADLNFMKGDAVSTAVLGHFDLTLKRGDFEVFVRTLAWYDYALKHGKRPYGNIPNGFARDALLSDAGFDPEAKFANVLFQQAYAHAYFKLGDDVALDARIGRQVLNWGVSQFFYSGINIINPPNAPGAVRAGAWPVDAKLPIGMAVADLTLGKNWSAAAVLPYEFRPVAFGGCGTFMVNNGGYATGCNFISMISSIDEATSLQRGIFLHRNPDVMAPDSGEFGVSLHYDAPELGTRFGAYAMNYHSRIPLLRASIANIAGGYGTLAPDFTRLADTQGCRYALLYPENIRLFGLSFDMRLDPTLRVFAELTHRPNQIVEYNTADVAVALLTRNPTSALNLALGINSLPPGSTFDDYTRFPSKTATIGINKVITGAFGAERLIAAGELGWNHVSHLPNPGVLRFGRSESYGAPAINGYPCIDTTLAQKACTYEGLVTTNAWGYRARLAATYPAGAFGATLTPSVLFSVDAHGTSEDNVTFIDGRRILRPAVRADWKDGYFAEVIYTRIFGGAYNLRTDRDTLSLVGGISF